MTANLDKKPKTPLIALLRSCRDDVEREEFAKLAGTSVSYLYQLGCCARLSCRVKLARKIVKASERMNKKTDGRVKTISLDQLATMCEGCAD